MVLVNGRCEESVGRVVLLGQTEVGQSWDCEQRRV